MPDFNDLKDIKEKLDNIGNEKKILDEKGLSSEELPLPDKDSSLINEEPVVDSQPAEENTNVEEDLLGDILEDFEKGHVIQDENNENAEIPFTGEEQTEPGSEELKDLLTDTEIKDDVEDETVDEGIEALLSGGFEEEPKIEEDNIEGIDDISTGFDEESEAGDFEIMQEKEDTGEGIEDFSKFLDEEGETEDISAEAGEDELDALLRQPLDEEPVSGNEEAGIMEDTSTIGDEELDALLNNPMEEETMPGIGEEEVKGDTSAIEEDELDSLLKQPSEEEKEMVIEQEPVIEAEGSDYDLADKYEESIPQDKEETASDEILEKLGEKDTESKFDDLPDLESLLGEGDISEEGIGEEIEKSESLEGILGEGSEGFEEEVQQDLEMPDLTTGETEEPIGLEGVLGEELKENEPEISDQFDFADKTDKEEELGLGETSGVDSDIIGEYPSYESKDEEFSDIGGFEVKDSSYGEIPEEISKEDLKADHDIKIDLTDDERKQIIISLTSLPKDAELKISKAIVSNKYSNAELKPLINALIDKESPHIIIKYYEKITGDKSLSAIEGVKYTGVKFEERKKTISYIFEKNILPFLAKVSVLIVIGVLIFFASRYIIHTWQITNLYKEGLKLIENKYYEDGEAKFQEAFKDQPRFREVVKYARKYREHKRYLATEGKYDLALNMRPENNDIALEYSDFLREKKDFERAERMYQGMIKTDRDKLKATLGLARTYFDWSEEETGKLEDAKDAYKDALEIDRNNKEAIFGDLRIYIKQKNQKAIISHYNYIEKNFKRNVDPEAYSELAEYFMNTDEINEVKNVLTRASRSIKRNEYYPEIEYQFARYNKQLSIFDEEKQHLENTLSIFERMKEEDPRQYESEKYTKLLANVYNDLGENAEISVKASPEAEQYYIKATEIDKNFGKPYYNLANFAFKYKPGGYEEAKKNYIIAENNGYKNDRLNYNLGWIYYKEKDYLNSYSRINRILEKQPENSNLKFMIGTIFYKLGKYELAESILLENYLHFMDLKEMYDPLDPAEKEDKIIMEMLKKDSNNLGAAYQKRYEETLNSRYIIKASKYYADSIIYFDKLENIYVSEVDVYGTNKETSTSQVTNKKGYANINFRMVLFPYAGVEDPILYEDFPYDYNIFM